MILLPLSSSFSSFFSSLQADFSENALLPTDFVEFNVADRPDVDGDIDLASRDKDDDTGGVVGVNDLELLLVCGVVGDCDGIGDVCGDGGNHIGERNTRATSPAPALT